MGKFAVTFVPFSRNSKTGNAAATYASQVTCPSSCPFKGNGCYAEAGPVAFTTRRLNQTATAHGYTAEEVTAQEAELIRDHASRRALPLRLHVVGDTPSIGAAQKLADASLYYRRVSGSPVWTYTHNWLDIPREAFGTISVLASCESLEQAHEAHRAGYAPAIVVDQHPEDGRAYRAGDLKVIPCPQQTRPDITCTDCKLCLDADRLHRNGAVIAFAVHGSGKAKASKALTRLDKLDLIPVQ
jgi:hypothetical protein